jgi:ribosomal protein S18 acetylase RimI-like enzyme
MATAGFARFRHRVNSNVKPPVEIRVLSPQDAEAFRVLRLRGLLECPAAFASSYAEEQSVAVATVAARLSSQGSGAVIGAFQRSAMVGVVGVKREEKAKLAHKAVLWGMYVSPEARNLGVGTALVERALRYATVVLQVEQVNLGVSTENTTALALYRRAGFQEYGCERRSMVVDGVAHDEYHMVCHVASAA